jgi:hypothetical protein
VFVLINLKSQFYFKHLEEIKIGWRKLHGEKLCMLYHLQHVTWKIKSGRNKCAGFYLEYCLFSKAKNWKLLHFTLHMLHVEEFYGTA